MQRRRRTRQAPRSPSKAKATSSKFFSSSQPQSGAPGKSINSHTVGVSSASGGGGGLAYSALELDSLYGLRGSVAGNLQYVDENEVVYAAGHTVVFYNLEKKTQRFIGHGAAHYAPAVPPPGAAAGGAAGGAAATSATTATDAAHWRGSISASLPPGTAEITAIALTTSKVNALAVAERGPERALISVFDAHTLKRRTKHPITCSDIESRDIVSMSFSPDGRSLLVQGGAPDWTLVNLQWEKNKILQSAGVSNQTSEPIHQVSAGPDSSAVCVSGNCILRFLRLEPGEFTSIHVSLGKRELQNYTCHTWVDDRVLVGTDSGDILVFENADFRGVLDSSPSNGKSVDAIAAYSKGFVAGCEEGVLYIFERDQREIYKATKSFQITDNYVHFRHISVSPSEENVSMSLENGQAFVLSLSNTDILKPEEMNFEPLVLPFHSHSVTGLDVCVRKPLIATCGEDKSIRIWDYVENKLDLIKYFEEEPLSVAFHPSGLHLLVGFSDSLRFLNVLMDDLRSFKELNIKHVQQVRFSRGGHLFAVANNTVVQLYSTYSCQVVRNFLGHQARVESLAWTKNDMGLVTVGSDGAVLQWSVSDAEPVEQFRDEQRDFHSVAVTSYGPPVYFVAAGDGTVRQMEFVRHSKHHRLVVANMVTVEHGVTSMCVVQPHGAVVSPVATDPTERIDSDALLMSSSASPPKAGKDGATAASSKQRGKQVSANSLNRALLVVGLDNGVIRVYPLPLTPFHQEYECHSAAVTRTCLSPDKTLLFSCAEDGTVSTFRVMVGGEQALSLTSVGLGASSTLVLPGGDMDGALGAGDLESFAALASTKRKARGLPWAEEILVTKSDLEEKLATIRELRNKVEELQYHNQMQLKLKEMNFQEKLREVTEKFNRELEANRERYELLDDARVDSKKRYDAAMEEMERRHETKVFEMQQYHASKLTGEQQRFEELQEQREQARQQFEESWRERERVYEAEVAQLKAEHEQRLAEERATRERLDAERRHIVEQFERKKGVMEDDADTEIDQLKAYYDRLLTTERQNTLKLKAHNSILKSRFANLREEIRRQKLEMKKKKGKEALLFEQIRAREKNIAGHSKEVEERNSTIGEKMRRIYELKKKNQELEKFKFVLDYKITELNRQIAPREEEIKSLRQQIQEMTAELRSYTESNRKLALEVKKRELALAGMDANLQKQLDEREAVKRQYKRIQAELALLADKLDSPAALKEGVKSVYQARVLEPAEALRAGRVGSAKKKGKDGGEQGSGVLPDEHVTYERQRNYLERTIDALKTKMRKDVKVHNKHHSRIMQENVALIREINELRREIQLIKIQQQQQDERERMMRFERKRALLGGPEQLDMLEHVPRPPSSARSSRSSRSGRRSRSSKNVLKRQVEAQQEQIAALHRQLEELGG